MIKYCQRLLYIHVPVYTQLNLKIDACTFDVYKRMIIYHDHDKKKNFPQYIYQLKKIFSYNYSQTVKCNV